MPVSILHLQQKSFIRQSVEPSIQVELPVIPVAGGDFEEEDLLIPDNEVGSVVIKRRFGYMCMRQQPNNT